MNPKTFNNAKNALIAKGLIEQYGVPGKGGTNYQGLRPNGAG